MAVPRQTAGIMRTSGWCRVMTMAAENITVMTSASPSPMGETSPEKEADTMMATPPITAAMAAHVAAFTRSPNTIQARRPANSGAAAWVSRMLATVVYCSATTKQDDATPKHTATPSPGSPMLRNIAAVALRPLAPQHEEQQEGRGEQRAPEHHRPAVLDVDEARDGAAEAPRHGGARDEQHPPAGNRRRGNGAESQELATWRTGIAPLKPAPQAPAGRNPWFKRSSTLAGLLPSSRALLSSPPCFAVRSPRAPALARLSARRALPSVLRSRAPPKNEKPRHFCRGFESQIACGLLEAILDGRTHGAEGVIGVALESWRLDGVVVACPPLAVAEVDVEVLEAEAPVVDAVFQPPPTVQPQLVVVGRSPSRLRCRRP